MDTKFAGRIKSCLCGRAGYEGPQLIQCKSGRNLISARYRFKQIDSELLTLPKDCAEFGA